MTAPPLLDDAADLSALGAKGADPDELFDVCVDVLARGIAAPDLAGRLPLR